MTIDEAKRKCKTLEKLNLDLWDSKSSMQKNKIRESFRSCWMAIQSNGFKIIRGKEFDATRGYRVPTFRVREDKNQDIISIVDNRDPNGYHKGDCTTRAISFCTGVDYMTIQKEQFANAKAYNGYGVTWRTPKIWSKSLTSRGFCEIEMPKNTSGKVFLRKLAKTSKVSNSIIAAKSAHHIAAIDMSKMKILDMWNSAGCRIKSIFVPVAEKEAWTKKLNAVFG